MSSEIPEKVQTCINFLRNSKGDSEKFAALFMVTKIIAGKDCTSYIKKLIFEAIGPNFMKKLLTSDEVPNDCPPHMYKSLALSILSALCTDTVIASHPDMVVHAPALLEIVDQVEKDVADDVLNMVNDAYLCLKSIAQFPLGQKVLIENNVVSKMCKIASEKRFKADEALAVLVGCSSASEIWEGNNFDQLQAIINKISLDFEADHTEKKFELCTILQALLCSCRQDGIMDRVKTESWPKCIRKGLNDILTSKIGSKQRDPALKLAAVMLDLLSTEWALSDEKKPKVFLLILIQLASIEIRMQLEERQLNTVMENADLILSCILILEISLSYIATDALELSLKEKQYLCNALNEAFSAIIQLLISIPKEVQNEKQKLFVCAMVRVLSAWLAQEALTIQSEIYSVLPIILTIAKNTFDDFRNKTTDIDLLRLLLPGLCNLSVNKEARDILLEHKVDEILLEYLYYHWIVINKKPSDSKLQKESCKEPAKKLTSAILQEVQDSQAAIVSIFNIFMNITILEGKLVEESSTFMNLLKFVFNNLPDLKQTPENLLIHGHLAILGLLILKQTGTNLKKNDFAVTKFIQVTTGYLRDTQIVVDNNNPPEFVSTIYKENWQEIRDLWYLGMKSMSEVVEIIPWLSEIAIKSGYTEDIIDKLKKVNIGDEETN